MPFDTTVARWVTLKQFCQMTATDLSIVKQNVKSKGSLYKFTGRLSPRSKIMINYRDWLLSVSKELRAA